MNTLAILTARESDLDTRHLIWAATRGLLIDLLTQTNLADERGLDWADIWEAHADAGHDEPEYTHTSDDDVNSENGAVWGIDTLNAFGTRHEVGWCANYGGNNPGWNGITRYDWVVNDDGEGCTHNECLAAMAAQYDIDLTDGQPSEPARHECERDHRPVQTVHAVTAEGELKEVEIYRYSHPKECMTSCGAYGYSDDDDIDPDDSPFPAYYSDEDGSDEYDSISDMIAALKEENHSVHDDEDEAEAAQLHRLASLAVDAHGQPEHYDLVIPDLDLPEARACDRCERTSYTVVEVPYLLPLNAEDVEEDRYHLDADEWRNVLDAGWVALSTTLTEAWGKRAMLAALKDERDYAEAILTNRPHTVWVSLASSYGAGNCRQGTAIFLRDHGIDTNIIGAMTAEALLAMEPHNPYLRKACQLAALGIR